MSTGQGDEAAMASAPADVVIITGMSGAGKSTTAKSLEDLDWYVIENLPPGLLPTMVDLAMRAKDEGALPADFRALATALGVTGGSSAASPVAIRRDGSIRRCDNTPVTAALRPVGERRCGAGGSAG